MSTVKENKKKNSSRIGDTKLFSSSSLKSLLNIGEKGPGVNKKVINLKFQNMLVTNLQVQLNDDYSAMVQKIVLEETGRNYVKLVLLNILFKCI